MYEYRSGSFQAFYFLEGEDSLVGWLLSQLVIKLLFLPQRDKILFHSTGEAVNIFRELISIYFENDTIHINTLNAKNANFLILRHVVLYVQLPRGF